MLSEYIEHRLKEEGITEDHPLIDENIYMYCIEYVNENRLTKEDIQLLNTLNIWLDDFQDIGLMYTTDDDGNELQLTYNRIAQEIRAFKNEELIATDAEEMGHEDLEQEAIDDCFQYYYERYYEITGE